MIAVEYKHHRYSIAECWEETTRKQVKTYIALYYQEINEIYGTDTDGSTIINDIALLASARLGLLYVLLGLSREEFKKIQFEQIISLLNDEKLVDFFLTKQDMITNRYPSIYRWFKKLHGPVKFEQLSFEEFGYADYYYHSYKNGGNTNALDMLVATLYRPGSGKKRITPDVDCRIPFEAAIIESRLPFVSKITHLTKMCVLLWYEHGRYLTSQEFYKVFEKQKANIPVAEPSPNNWQLVVNNLAKHNPADFDSVASKSVVRILATLQQIILENEDLERRIKNASPTV